MFRFIVSIQPHTTQRSNRLSAIVLVFCLQSIAASQYSNESAVHVCMCAGVQQQHLFEIVSVLECMTYKQVVFEMRIYI